MNATVTIAGEVLELCPERAVYWPRGRILLVADPHFGKAATFRVLGIHVPRGTTAVGLARLDLLLERHHVVTIVFLGDFLHAREGRNDGTFAALASWRASHADVAMQIVRGNHDRRAGDPPAIVGIECVDGPYAAPPFTLAHHPVEIAGSYVLAGHLHPCGTLIGAGRQRERLPCFWFSRSVGVLPAFGDFTGCAGVAASGDDTVWVVAGDHVLQVTRHES